jgi:Bacterial SH3 domain
MVFPMLTTLSLLLSVLGLMALPNPARAQIATVRVAVARASVQQAPSDESTVVAHVTYGQELEVRGEQDGWYKVVARVGPARVEAYLPQRVVASKSPGAGAGDAASEAPSAPLKVPGISVAADAAGKTTWLTPLRTRAVPVTAPVSSLGEVTIEALMMALGGLTKLPPDPAADVTWVWAAPRQDASLIPGRSPSFFVSYRDAQGVNIADLTVAVIRLVPAAGPWSLVGMSRQSAASADSADANWTISRELKDEAVTTTNRGTAVGVMDVRLNAPLAAGTYAVVLRPFFPRKYAGRDVLGSDGIGLVFSYAWPFAIK